MTEQKEKEEWDGVKDIPPPPLTSCYISSYGYSCANFVLLFFFFFSLFPSPSSCYDIYLSVPVIKGMYACTCTTIDHSIKGSQTYNIYLLVLEI